MCRMLVGVSFILRLGPGPVSWEAELQLDTGQKKSVLTTPHFVLRDTADTLPWIVKYFVRFAIFRIHTLTQQGLRCFHSTVVKGFTIQCLFVRYWNGRNMRGARARMEMALSCHAMLCAGCRCGDR